MPDIFISHVEEDSAIALQIAQGLEAAGYTSWYYERDSVPGLSYLVQTGQAIEQSKAVVLLVSSHSIESNQVTSEVVRAHEGGKPFIPVLYGISHTDFQHRQPLWRQAVGSAASISVPTAGISAILPRIIAGLKSLEVLPGGKVTASAAPPPGPVRVSPAGETQGREREAVVVSAGRPSFRESKWFPVLVVVLLLQAIVILALALRLMQLASRPAVIKPGAAGPTPTQMAAARPSSTPRPATSTPRSSSTLASQAAATATASREMGAVPTSFEPLIATAEAVATSMAGGMSTPEVGVSVQPVQGFGLPLRDPNLVLYDGSALWVTFAEKWKKLELVEAEQRFRGLDEEWSLASRTVAWDLSWDWYWARMEAGVDIVSRSGTKTASYALPEDFTSGIIVWDGRSLWALHGDDTLYRYEPAADSGQLKKVDTYAPQVQRLGLSTLSGLTWDGNNLWVLGVGSVFKLNSAAQPICAVDLGGSWTYVRSWRGLGWDGRFLWAADAHSNMLYRVDPNACQE